MIVDSSPDSRVSDGKASIIRNLLAISCFGLPLLFLAAPSPANAQCTSLIIYGDSAQKKWNTHCGKDSLSLEYNYDGFVWDARIMICIEQRNGKWDCGSKIVKTGENFIYYGCQPTGHYIIVGAVADGNEYNNCLGDPNKYEDGPFWPHFASKPENK